MKTLEIEKVHGNSALAQKLERRAELEAAAKEFKKLDDEVKEELREMGPVVQVGRFVVQNVKKTMTQYDVPKEVKEPYARIKEYTQTTITETK